MPSWDEEARRLGLDDHFEIRSVLGQGGMGCVYEAVQKSLGRDVALKVLKQPAGGGDDPIYRERFLREASLASQIKHPHLVGVLDYGQTAKCLYIAYQRVRGPSLAQRLRREGALDEREVATLFASLLDALNALHHHGVVHRDLKPGNILLEGSHPFITDLGIAQEKDGPRLTAAETTVGTPSYMAPEQIQGQPVGPAADFYALGCVIFETLSGSPPYSGKPMAVLQSHLRAVIPRVEPRRAGLAPGWNRIIQRALSKEPAERFESATEFRDELTRLAEAFDMRRPAIPIQETPAEGFVATSATATTLGRIETPSAARHRRRKRNTQGAFALAALVTISIVAAGLLPRGTTPALSTAASIQPNPAPSPVETPPDEISPRVAELIAKHLQKIGDVTSVTNAGAKVYGLRAGTETSGYLAALWSQVHERSAGIPLGPHETALALPILDPEALERVEIRGSKAVQLAAIGPELIDTLTMDPDASGVTVLRASFLAAGLNVLIVRNPPASGILELRADLVPKRGAVPRAPDRLEVPKALRATLDRIREKQENEVWHFPAQELEALLHHEPDLLEAHYMLALSRTRMARMQLQGGRASALSFIVDGFYRNGENGSPVEENLAGAISEIGRVLDARPREGRTWSLLGLLFTELGMIEAGVDALEHACRLAPREPVTWESLGDSYEPIPHDMVVGRSMLDGANASGPPYLAVRPGVPPGRIQDLVDFARIAQELYRIRNDRRGVKRCENRIVQLEKHVRNVTKAADGGGR